MDWFLGFLGGVLATLLGFGLTVAWELRKEKRHTAERDAAIERAIELDLAQNKKAIGRNLQILAEELRVLGKNQHVVHPMVLIQTTFWDVVRINPPVKLVVSGKLAQLSAVLSKADEVNDYLRSREAHRLNNEAMDNFSRRLRIYDETLVETLKELGRRVDAYSSIEVQQQAPADIPASRGRG